LRATRGLCSVHSSTNSSPAVELARYCAMEALRDGRPVEIRALQPGDRDELAAAVRRMSDESIYRRFFSAKRHFTDRELEFYTSVDFVSHVALVAALTEGERFVIAGGGRYVATEPGAAEVAFAVDDAHQGLGIGKLLMKHLVAIARLSGLHRLTAEVLAGNAAMLKVFEKSGLRVHTQRERDTVHVTLELV
jgi:GNAT superfamily N-acetyltransferase